MIYTATTFNYKIKRSDIRCFPPPGKFLHEPMESKIFKILPYLYFSDDVTIWIDANIQMLITPEEAVQRYLGRNDMAIFTHPHRCCAYQEFEVLTRQPRFRIPELQKLLNEQREYYEKQKFPRKFGLWECNFIIRRNNSKVNQLMAMWWAEICRWQWRDQVSFPYVLWKYGSEIKLNTITEGDIREHENFKYTNHYV